MRNIKLTIEYDGTNYCGWQIQHRNKCKKSIQEILESVLQKIFLKKIKVVGSGRTDAGVHALSQVANFNTNSKIAIEKLKKALNSNLPDDIVITKIEEVSPEFHSRFAAKSKVYRYTILNRNYPSALLRNRVYFYPYPLDIKLMRQETKCLLGRHDFKAFCATGGSPKDTIRTIKRITIRKLPYHLSPITYHLRDCSIIAIDIEADGFLYNMVRNIVGTLIEIGRRRLPKGSLKKILLYRDRRLAGPTVPAKGLYLVKVQY